MGSDTDFMVLGATAAVAVAASLLVWAAIDIGTNGLTRYRRVFTERTHFNLREMFLFIEPSRLFALNLVVILLGGVSAWLFSGSGSLGLIVAVSLGFLPRVLLRWMHARRLDQMEQQLPDALMMLAGGMRAGVSLTQALQQLVIEGRPPLSQEVDLVLREQRLGVALDEALDNLNKRVPLQSMTLTVSAMRIAAETGGQLAETLERTSQTLRSKLAMEGKIRALTSQGKLQAWVVGALPVFLILALRELEPAAMGMMFTTPMGWGALAVIVLLEFFGVLLIRKIVAIDV